MGGPFHTPMWRAVFICVGCTGVLGRQPVQINDWQRLYGPTQISKCIPDYTAMLKRCMHQNTDRLHFDPCIGPAQMYSEDGFGDPCRLVHLPALSLIWTGCLHTDSLNTCHSAWIKTALLTGKLGLWVPIPCLSFKLWHPISSLLPAISHRLLHTFQFSLKVYYTL